MPGPYFQGQKPSECGHYYPDVLRLRDEKRPDGTFVRIVDCSVCGRYEFPLDVKTLARDIVRNLNKHGFDAGVREDELSKVRKKALVEFAAKEKIREKALQLFQGMIEDAIQDEADAIELEYVPEGLKVTTMFGNTGIGSVVNDRRLAGEIISLIIERAKLQNKSRGRMDWTYKDKSYKIKAEENEIFGEYTYRLILKRQ